MNGNPTTDRLVHELACDLTPVRRVPRLRVALGGVLLLWLTVAAVALATVGARADLATVLSNDLLFGGVFVGLLLTALGGSVAGLAAGVPGRGSAVRAGGALALAGLGLAVGICVVLMVSLGLEPGNAVAHDGVCLGRATTFAVLPATGILALLLRGWVLHPVRAAAVSLIGGLALGAVVAHLSCPFYGPRHFLLGHTLGPVIVALLVTLPLGATLRRWAR